MILDNSTIPPPGSEMGFDNRLGLGLVMYVWQVNQATKQKILFNRLPYSKEFIVQGIPDLATVDPPRAWDSIDTVQEAGLKKNYEKNLSAIKEARSFKHPESNTVLLVGAGNITEDDLATLHTLKGEIPIVTMGSAQRKYIVGDYYMGMDPHRDHFHNPFEEKPFEWPANNTIAHLAVDVYPEIAAIPWKEVAWWGSRFGHDYDIPMYHAGKNVGFCALQFAARTLMADNIILIGFEHPLMNVDKDMRFQYYDAAIDMMGACWWLSRAGIRVWNCSTPSTINCGVIMGSLDKAMEMIKKP